MEPGAIDPTANPDEQQLDENGNPIPQAPSNISEEVMQDMKNIWSVFDEGDKDEVTLKELRTIMKALDVNCEDDDVLECLQKMIDPENTGFITFKRLTSVMEEQLKEKDTVEDLVEQLQKLDKDGDGKIPTPEFRRYMTTMGLNMKPEDLDDMLKMADPKGDGNVDIAEFAEAFCPPRK